MISADQSLLATRKMLERLKLSSSTWRERTLCTSDDPARYPGAAVAEVVGNEAVRVDSAFTFAEGGLWGGYQASLWEHAVQSAGFHFLGVCEMTQTSGVLPCHTALGNCLFSFVGVMPA